MWSKYMFLIKQVLHVELHVVFGTTHCHSHYQAEAINSYFWL